MNELEDLRFQIDLFERSLTNPGANERRAEVEGFAERLEEKGDIWAARFYRQSHDPEYILGRLETIRMNSEYKRDMSGARNELRRLAQCREYAWEQTSWNREYELRLKLAKFTRSRGETAETVRRKAAVSQAAQHIPKERFKPQYVATESWGYGNDNLSKSQKEVQKEFRDFDEILQWLRRKANLSAIKQMIFSDI